MFRIICPVKDLKYITVKFNQWYIYGKHTGIDYRTKNNKYPKGIGMPIYACADGIWKEIDADKNKKGKYIQRGKYVILEHENGYTSRYYHLSKQNYQEGWREVKMGDCIGYSGNTGKSTFGHLHFEIRKNNIKVNPQEFIDNSKKLIEWSKRRVLLRINNKGRINYVTENEIKEINKDNCWEVLTQTAIGISENDFNILIKLYENTNQKNTNLP